MVPTSRRKATILTHLAFFGALLTMLACNSATTARRTQLVLVADTNIAALDEVTFEVTSPTGAVQRATGSIAIGEPAFLTLLHESAGPLGPFRVVAQGLAAGTPRVSRVASVTFIAGSARTVLLHLVEACESTLVCTGASVCGHTGCRDETIAPEELPPWTGKPPTLDPSEPDGGTDAAVESDGGPGADAGPDGGGCTPRCDGDSLEVCSDGMVTGRELCTTSDPCSVAACEDGVGCVTRAANDGAPCGGGDLTCLGGVCGAGQACTGSCKPRCDPEVLSCSLDCGATGSDCDPACGAGASCDIQCDGISNCRVDCAGTCRVTCGDASNCPVTCKGGSSCDIDCTGEANCDKTRCDPGASCLLRCGADNNCEFDRCTGGQPVDCGGGILACNSACP